MKDVKATIVVASEFTRQANTPFLGLAEIPETVEKGFFSLLQLPSENQIVLQNPTPLRNDQRQLSTISLNIMFERIEE